MPEASRPFEPRVEVSSAFGEADRPRFGPINNGWGVSISVSILKYAVVFGPGIWYKDKEYDDWLSMIGINRF